MSSSAFAPSSRLLEGVKADELIDGQHHVITASPHEIDEVLWRAMLKDELLRFQVLFWGKSGQQGGCSNKHLAHAITVSEVIA